MLGKQCTLPSAAWLRQQTYHPAGGRVYTDDEIAQLEEIRPLFNKMDKVDTRRELGREMLRAMWPDEKTYIAKQHWIATKTPGITTVIDWNYVQRGFYKVVEQQRAAGVPIRIITLKARQLGQSTGIQSWHYEQCDRNDDRVAATITHKKDATLEMFRKAHRIHKSVWFPRKTVTDRSDRIQLANRSMFLTETAQNLDAGRSMTFHHLHISELPMWPNATDVLDGLLQSVPYEPGTSVFIESTARGVGNEFYKMWTDAENGDNDYYPYFAPWFDEPAYKDSLTDRTQREFRRSMSREEREYQEKYGLSIEQMSWRRRKIKTELRGSMRKWAQEYPACPEEAFLSSGHPAFNQEAIARLDSNVAPCRWRGNIYLDVSTKSA